MSEADLLCPRCGSRLVLEDQPPGVYIHCPHCARSVLVPPKSPSAAPPVLPPIDTVDTPTMFCPKCGTKNLENNHKCTQCGFLLHGASAPPPVGVKTDNSLGGLIPTKNPLALWAYYLGIVALIPCLGLPFGIAAIITGIKGLAHAKRFPEAKGGAHAYVGIICGSLSTLGNAVAIVLMISAMRR